ncbi:MAG: FapA family protein [bacterium]|nr:FapA family protein [bacterium]
MEIRQQSVNGYFRIDMRDADIFLTVCPPVGEGRRVEVNDILRELHNQRMTDYDLRAITMAVSGKEAKPVRIGSRIFAVSGKRRSVVKVSDDKMKATVNITPIMGDADKPSLNEIKNDLAAAGVVYGIDEFLIQEILQNKIFDEPVVVAKGCPPVDGKSATIEYFFNTEKKRAPFAMSEDGSVDFREIGLIQTVKAGDVLAKKVATNKGIPGMTVTGQPLPAIDGKDIVLHKGKNVLINNNETELTAAVKGQIIWDGSKIEVDPVCKIKGDVCFETGNIYFNGALIIDGNVREGFVVKADDDIEIKGNIEKAYVESLEGSVTVQGGIVGIGQDSIRAQKKITAKFVQNASLCARGDIIVTEFILHSFVDSGESVFVTRGEKGAIIGGKIRATKEVCAKTIGNVAETVTIIQVGIDPEIREEMNSIVHDILNAQDELKKAVMDVNTLRAMKERSGSLSPEKEEAYQLAISMQIAMTSEIKYLKQRNENLQKEMEFLKGGKIAVMEHIYPRVKITIVKAEHELKEIKKNICFYSRLGSITSSSYTG